MGERAERQSALIGLQPKPYLQGAHRKSPEPVYAIIFKGHIGADNREPIPKRVSDNFPVKRVTVILVGEQETRRVTPLVSSWARVGRPVTKINGMWQAQVRPHVPAESILRTISAC
jgi:hypothetical protein